MNATQAVVLDKKVLESLASLGGDELLLELYDLFLQTVEPQLQDLVKAVAAQDAKKVYQLAHGLKSSCANLGAMRLSQTCLQLEVMGKDARLDGAAELAGRLIPEYSEAQVLLAQAVKKT